jgi:uncharacterized Zn-binding protein involved in type VI secretion
MRQMAREHSTSQGEHGTEPLAKGAPKVLVHGGRAWRAVEDQFDCKLHGPEAVPVGHTRVLVQGKQAVRVGDFLLGGGAPDEIQEPDDNRVMLGDDGAGLESDEGMKAWCEEWCAFEDAWGGMTEQERRAAYEALVARMFAQFGAPAPQVVFADPRLNPQTGNMDFTGGYIDVINGTYGVGSQYFLQAKPGDLRRVTFHETRHGEQLFQGIRYARQRRRQGNPLPGDVTSEKNTALVEAADRMPDFVPGSKEEGFARLHAEGYSRDTGMDQLRWANGDYDNRYQDIPGGADANRLHSRPAAECACAGDT